MSFLFSLGSLYGIYAVFSKSWDWFPLELTLAILVPWAAYTLYLMFRRPVIGAESHFAALLEHGLSRCAVDVLIPVCGESTAVVENTLLHATQMDWRGPLRVHVLGEREDLAVRRDGKCGHGPIVIEFRKLLGRGDLPNADSMILAARGQFFAGRHDQRE